MTLEVLISTMNQTDYSLLEKMNVQSDAIVINQCGNYSYHEFLYNGHRIKWYSVDEKGIGLSRNTALARSDSDIVLFADDDVVYVNNYVDLVIEAFKKNDRTDMFVFNILSANPSRPEYVIQKSEQLRWYNCLKYGACRIAIRRERLLRKNVWFSLLFGGGAIHQAGEDNLFISNCINAGLLCFSNPVTIGTAEQKESTWFKGYNDSYYYDRGSLFAALYNWKAYIVVILFEIKTKEKIKNKWAHLKCEIEGINRFLKS